ncbi:hypothetical protein [Actinoplanes sp. G11-F43]|uniref:hypothetical protein n=1 Tax=Actinoplanes sp. G11-F43 TaxID=3424130 RepID=UPI003D33AF1D
MPDSSARSAALASLEAVVSDAEAALSSARARGLFQPGHRIDLERSILGDEVYRVPLTSAEGEDSEAFSHSDVIAFHLPVFVGFDYAVNVSGQGLVWGQRFLRQQSYSTPSVTLIRDLRPWRFVKEELEPFLSRKVVVDEFSFSETISGEPTFGDSHGTSGGRLTLRFDFGLLQSVNSEG